MLRYYPKSKIKTNLITNGNQFSLNGKPYSGKYYETYDGKYFSGANPVVGDNQRLEKIPLNVSRINKMSIKSNDPSQGLVDYATPKTTSDFDFDSRFSTPISYFPRPSEEDYRKGYITRYFIKGINQNGYITEISPSEYANFQDGTVNYDVSFYLTGKMNWKIIGPLNTIRLSQYDIRMGIEDMNKSETEKLNKTFLGIMDFIGGRYEEFARPTR